MRQLWPIRAVLCALICVPAGSAADWTRQFGSPASDTVNAVAADGTGVYAAGYTFGALPGQTRVGGIIDAFLLKYDANGNIQWTRQFGTASDEAAWAVAASNNSVYVAGETRGAFPGQTNSGLADIYLRKYDSAGNLLWTRQYGTAGDEYASYLALDGAFIYVAGYTTGSVEGLNAGGVDAVLAKFDENGNLVWARQFGTSGTDYGYTVAVDGTGVYVAGETFGALTGQIAGGHASPAGVHSEFVSGACGGECGPCPLGEQRNCVGACQQRNPRDSGYQRLLPVGRQNQNAFYTGCLDLLGGGASSRLAGGDSGSSPRELDESQLLSAGSCANQSGGARRGIESSGAGCHDTLPCGGYSIHDALPVRRADAPGE
jgi:hypothetical protein